MKYLRRSKNVFLGFLVASIAALSFVCVKNSQQNTVHAWDGSTATRPSGGGTSSSPYLIASAENLAWFRNRISNEGYCQECAKLTANIDLSNKSWSPIGKSNLPFLGTLDGNGYTISNLYFNGSGTDYVGLVGYAGNNSFTANIRNIKLSNVNITGRDYVGAICGYGKALIDNCQTINGTVSGRKNVAGIVGYIDGGSIDSSSNGANISNSGSGCCCCAGIAGYVINCHDISYSYNTGTISGHEETGGVCAYVKNGVDISYCYNSGAVNSNGYDYCGGIVSDVGGSNNDVIITACYNAGNITGKSKIGGILGARWSSSDFTGIQVTIYRCHNFGNISASSGANYAPILGDKSGLYSINVRESYYKSDSANSSWEGIQKTATQFASGEVAYLLNGSTSGSDKVWKQNLDNGQTANAYPVFSGGTVYYRKYCDNAFAKYSNSSTVIHRHTNDTHYDSKGFCNRNSCGGYQTATLSSSYYQINNAGKLFWFAALVNGDKSKADFSSQNKSANGKLTANINLENRAWTPIGNSSTNTFLGTFDGGNYTISNLKVSRSGLDNNGLVGWCGTYMGAVATLKNVNITGATIEGQNYTGILLGWGRANISNCHVSGTITNSNNLAGGIVGELYQGTVTGCSNAANVKGYWKAAGICGSIKYGGTVSNCYNTGNITGIDGSLTTPKSGENYHAGIIAAFGDVADNHTTPSTITANIQNCYNVGSICGLGGVTGIVGAPDAGASNNGIAMTCNISNCHNFGDIMAGGNDAGYMLSSKNRCTPVVTNCYYKSDCIKSTTTNLSGAGLGTSKTAAQFSSGEVTYLLNGSTSGSGNVWKQNLDSGTPNAYPIFSGGVVYNIKYCDNSASTQYTNTSGKILHRETNDDQYDSKGFCTRNNCGGYQTPIHIIDGYNQDYSSHYEINNAGNLFWFAALVNGDKSKADFSSQNRSANAKLIADIDLENKSWTPIGLCTGHTVGALYNGTFDGQYHTVSGVKADSASNTLFYSGLFGGAESGALIKNVGVLNSSFVANKSAGGILGGTTTNANTVSVQNCWADNCTMSVTVTSDANQVAGIVGGMWNDSSPIAVTNCYVHTITAPGSIVGQASNNAISNCYTLTNKPIAATSGTNVTNCYYKDYSDSQGTSKTAQQFASGEVTYLLNGSTSGSGNVWKQNLDSGTPNAYPIFSGGVVYNIKYCDNSASTQYTNTSGKVIHRHIDSNQYENGFCSNGGCGWYEIPNLSDGYYQIDNAGKLFWFASVVNDDHSKADFSSQNVSANAELAADIDLENRAWTPIGNSSTNTFLGTFDGGNYTINNLNVSRSGLDNNGLVGRCGLYDGNASNNTATLKNVNITGATIEGKNYTGILLGGGRANISNCHVSGTITNSNNLAGGIVGELYQGTVTGCSNAAAVRGRWKAAGICGSIKYGGTVSNCYNTGNITGIDGSLTTPKSGENYHAGIVGGFGSAADDYTTPSTITTDVQNCYNVGSICGFGGATGIVGSPDAGAFTNGISTAINISNCYNFGDIMAGNNIAGHILANKNDCTHNVTNSYYKEGCLTAPNPNSADLGTSKTAEEFANWAVKDLLQAYVDDHSSDGLCNWAQGGSYPIFDTGNFENPTVTWNGDFTFSITKTWHPQTHTYSGSWQAQQTGDNIVINNPDLKAKLRVTPSFGDKATEFDVKFYKDAVEITGPQEVGLGQALTIIVKTVEGQCDVFGELLDNLLGRINLNITR